MEDSFKVKVDSVFGSLTPASTSSLPSLWSLTGEEVEKKAWLHHKGNNNNDRVEATSSRSFNGVHLSNLSLEAEEEKYQEEEEIKGLMGLDCTLDNEVEEDENDLVALARGSNSNHLFMKDVKDDGLYLNSCNVLLDSFEDHVRDPRAGFMAARLRLQEDSMESILKRKENKVDIGNKRILIEKPEGAEEERLPDYIVNPRRYTRYSFDSAPEVDQNSNQQSYMDFLNLIAGSRRENPSSVSDDVLMSVTFIPRKKSTSDPSKKTTVIRTRVVPGVDDEAFAMEEDGMEADVKKKDGGRKGTGRKYRSKIRAEGSVDY